MPQRRPGVRRDRSLSPPVVATMNRRVMMCRDSAPLRRSRSPGLARPHRAAEHGVRRRSRSPGVANPRRAAHGVRRRSRSPDVVRPYHAADDAVRHRSRSPDVARPYRAVDVRRQFSDRFADEMRTDQYRPMYISEGLPRDSDTYREAAVAKEPSGLGERVLLQKSLNLQDGSSRTFYSLPTESGRDKEASLLVDSKKYGGVYASGAYGSSSASIGHGDDPRQRLYSSNLSARDPFDVGRSYHSIPSSSDPTKVFGSLPASLPKDGLLTSYASGTFGSSDGKYKSSSNSDVYNRLPVSNHGNRLSLKDSYHYDEVTGISAPNVSYRDGPPLELSKKIPSKLGYEYSALGQRVTTSGNDYWMMSSGYDLLTSKEARTSGLKSEHLGKSYETFGESTSGALIAPRVAYHNNKFHELEKPPFAKEESGFKNCMEPGSSLSDFRSRASRADGISHHKRDYGFAANEASLTDYGRRLNDPPKIAYQTRPYENRNELQSSLLEFRERDSYGSRIARRRSPDENGRLHRRISSPIKPSAFEASAELNIRGYERNIYDPTDPLAYQSTAFAQKDHLQRISFLNLPPVSNEEALPEGLLVEQSSYDALGTRKKNRIPKSGQPNFSRKSVLLKNKYSPKQSRHLKSIKEERLYAENIVDEGSEEYIPPLVVKREPVDPSEGSDEFNLLVRKAFLRFSKQLNEKVARQRKYMEQGKVGALLCFVCGRDSKEFGDMHSLIAHSFSSCKGLRSDHLGLHKALCVMMGWNSLIPPDMSKKYQVMNAAEAAEPKEDLIVWPAVVILHNSSIGINKTDSQEVVTNEKMEEILGELGFDGGRAKVCRGKPANQSILLVKFMPTFSGLQEAEKLHKYLGDKKRGRKEWLQIGSGDKQIGRVVGKEGIDGGSKLERLFYGYVAIAEDLAMFDFDTKKRSVIKSKKEIAAIADASINQY